MRNRKSGGKLRTLTTKPQWVGWPGWFKLWVVRCRALMLLGGLMLVPLAGPAQAATNPLVVLTGSVNQAQLTQPGELLAGVAEPETETTGSGRNGASPAPATALTPDPGTHPRRVVSLNYCYDALLERWDYPAEAWSGVHDHGGRVESILAFAPDVVLVSPFNDPYLVRTLHQQGLELVQLLAPESIQEVRTLLVAVGQALTDPALREGRWEPLEGGLAGSPTERSSRATGMAGRPLAVVPGALEFPALAVLDLRAVEQLLAQVAELEAGQVAPAELPGQGRTVVFYQPNQWSWGRDNLMHELLTATGFHNLAAEAGAGLVRVSLEQLVWWQPDVLIREQQGRDFALAQLPLLHRVLARQGSQQLGFPGGLSGCLAQRLPDAVRFLQQEATP